MLLSIGMIVKNEEKYLRDCLTALTPILDAIESELIIYDTGSSDGTVDIAKEFTQNVFHIEWRDDFAWARNHTLRKAKGKWYMYVDADEIFEDTEGIIEFFKSGKYRRFRSATFRLENLTAPGAGASTAFHPMRLLKKEKDTVFVGKIHESIGLQYPVCDLSARALHHGYKYETLEEVRVKSTRNLKPLLEELEAKPNNPRTTWHIVNEYVNMQDYHEAARLNELGQAAAKPNDIFFDALILQYTKICEIRKNQEDLIETCRSYFVKAKNIQQIAIELRLKEADTCYALKRYDEAMVAYKQAHELFMQNKDKRLNEEFCRRFPVNVSYLEDESFSIKGILNVHVALRDFDAAWEWVKAHPEVLSSVKRGQLYIMYGTILLIDKRPEDAVHLYEYAVENFPPDSEDFIEAIMPIEKMFHSKDKRTLIAETVSNFADSKTTPLKDDYAMLNRLRVMYNNGETLLLKKSLDHFLQKDGEINQIYAEMIVYAIHTGCDFSAFLQNLRVTNTSAMCKSLSRVENASSILLEYMEKMGDSLMQEASMKLLRLMGHIANFFLAAASTEEAQDVKVSKENDSLENASDDEEEVIELQNETKIRFFEVAAKLNHRLLKLMYKEDVYCENSRGILPERDEFYYYAGTAYEKKEAGDLLGFVRNMRHAVKLSEHIREIAKLILKRLEEQVIPTVQERPKNLQDQLLERLEEQIKPPEPVSQKSLQDQLKDEISNLKDIIYAAIKAGDRDKASMLIRSYAAINPSDPDIPTIKQMIESWIQK